MHCAKCTGGDEMSGAPHLDSIETVLKLALHEEELLANRANWLDTKTGAVLGFVIVSVAELLGFLFLASADHQSNKLAVAHPCLTAVLFSIGLLAIIAAMMLGLRELSPMGFQFGASTEYLSTQLHREASDIKVECINSMRGTSKKNRDIVNEKAKLAKLTVIFVGIAVLCYAIAVAILFFSLL